ncbi:MAG: tetratricopeptide repeat protein [Acidobacteria bacterium]|nr:tetratricopeptide repeat protein [Acidobacteriota bacterium]
MSRSPLAVMIAIGAVAASACTSRTDAPAPHGPAAQHAGERSDPSAAEAGARGLLPVSLPDLKTMTASVQKQIRTTHELMLKKMVNRQTAVPDLADAYGDLGKLLMAADYPDAAEPCFMNARTLAPDDYRWSYYLAHVYRKRGDLDKAQPAFERALQLHPDDVATLVWLGDVALAQGRAEDAEPRFSRALALDPASLSARFGLGRAALARQQYRQAAGYLEDVLARDPNAAGAHYPLGMAYRGLGDSKKAEAQLRLRKNRDILPADPLIVEIEELLESPTAYEARGIRALDNKRWPEAAALFRKGLELAPDSAALRHRLGTTLFMMGDSPGAQNQFEQVVRASPDYFLAQYSLGVMLEDQGRYADAIDRFSAALRVRSSYTEARLRLAASLRKAGRASESLPHYQQILNVDANQTEARFGRAMTLVQLGRYQEARDHLADDVNAYPTQTVFAHGLARLLAGAPDDHVRDGDRALALIGELLSREQRTLDLGETMAMALAAAARYDEAVRVQQDLLRGAEASGLTRVVSRLAANLVLYERRQPCRTPWPPGEIP